MSKKSDKQNKSKKKAAALPGAEKPKAELPSPSPEILVKIEAEKRHTARVHYYFKLGVSTFLCALLLIIGVPVFMESRVTGSLSYTALGCVLVAFGLLLAVAVVLMLFHPPEIFRRTDDANPPADG